MKRSTLILVALLSADGTVLADDSFRDTVKIVSQPTPSHYIAYASGLAAEAELVEDERERIKGYGRAIVHLMVIPERWPDDRESIISARLGIADISLLMGAVNRASEQMDLAEQVARAEELPLIVRRRLEIASAIGNEADGQRYALWLDRGRIERLADGQRTPIYLSIVEFYESVGDHRNAGLRAAEFARSELHGVPAAALRVRAARSFLAANDRAEVRALVAEARRELLVVIGNEEVAERHTMIKALHEELDDLLLKCEGGS